MSELGVDCIEQGARFVAIEHRRPTFLHDVAGSSHRVCWIHFDNVAHHQPIKEHAQRGQVLLYGSALRVHSPSMYAAT